MHLVEVFIPISPSAAGFERLEQIKRALTARFGGVTAFTRAPAEGLWKTSSHSIEADQIVIVEVMVPDIDLGWWEGFKSKLERELGQKEILVRYSAVERI